jgi:predicted secreted Zn-dependent protease
VAIDRSKTASRFSPALVLLVAVAGIAAKPSISRRVEHYDVRGSSLRALRASIDRSGPRDAAGEKADALTEWQVRWKYAFESRRGSCVLTSFEASLEITMLLPRWRNRRSGTELAARWDRYLRALIEHEEGHAEIAEEAVEAVQERGESIRPASSCGELARNLRSAAGAVLREYRKRELEYDRRTKHGVAQGVVLP